MGGISSIERFRLIVDKFRIGNQERQLILTVFSIAAVVVVVAAAYLRQAPVPADAVRAETSIAPLQPLFDRSTSTATTTATTTGQALRSKAGPSASFAYTPPSTTTAAPVRASG